MPDINFDLSPQQNALSWVSSGWYAGRHFHEALNPKTTYLGKIYHVVMGLIDLFPIIGRITSFAEKHFATRCTIPASPLTESAENILNKLKTIECGSQFEDILRVGAHKAFGYSDRSFREDFQKEEHKRRKLAGISEPKAYTPQIMQQIRNRIDDIERESRILENRFIQALATQGRQIFYNASGNRVFVYDEQTLFALLQANESRVYALSSQNENASELIQQLKSTFQKNEGSRCARIFAELIANSHWEISDTNLIHEAFADPRREYGPC